jgi:splicing factor 3B subunit 5
MSSSAYRSSMNSQLEHLQSKYVGTGHADITKWEWAVNIHRDSLSAHLGNPGMLMYSSISLGESMGRTKYNLLMVSPYFTSSFSFMQFPTLTPLSPLPLPPTFLSFPSLQTHLDPCRKWFRRVALRLPKRTTKARLHVTFSFLAYESDPRFRALNANPVPAIPNLFVRCKAAASDYVSSRVSL